MIFTSLAIFVLGKKFKMLLMKAVMLSFKASDGGYCTVGQIR
jgi:hypothetical protein